MCYEERNVALTGGSEEAWVKGNISVIGLTDKLVAERTNSKEGLRGKPFFDHAHLELLL